jgi:tetratricopeptide (TPR) repeat protein
MSVDVRGLPITVANDEALAAYERAIAGYLAQKRDTMDELDAALAADPEFVLAHCLKAYLLRMAYDPAFLPAARDSVAAAKKVSAGATDREQRHVSAAELLLDEDIVEALAILDGVAIDHPTDLVTLKLTQFTHFWRGDAANMRDVIGRALYAWEPGMPGYGFVLGLLSFGFEENGEYGSAERVGREAVDLNPEDSWAVHAVAHTIEMEGRHSDGIDWLRQTEPGWLENNNFRFHLWWHRSLYHLERGEYDEVFDLYDTGIRGEKTDFATDIANGSALLWRLYLRGVDVGDRWEELGERAEAHARDAVNTFFNANYMMALLATGRRGAADTLLAATRDDTARHDPHASRAVDAGVAISEGLWAFHDGDYGRAVDLMLPVRYDHYLFGGSHAQRDVFDQTLVLSTIRSGRDALTRALIAERETRHGQVPDAWKAEAALAAH